MTAKTPAEQPVERVARNTRRLRELRGLSQKQLAEAARLDRSDVSRIENARGDDLGTKKLQRLAHALGVDIQDLLARPS